MAAKRKVTERQVRWLKNLHDNRPDIPVSHLARAIGCSRQHALDIIRGRRRVAAQPEGSPHG